MLLKKRKVIIFTCFLLAMLLISSCAPKKGLKDNHPDIQKQSQKGKSSQLKKSEENNYIKESNTEKPELPEGIKSSPGKEPSLSVYIVQEEAVKEMPFEEYVAGVVAGEIKNDWPEEIIKAQAIIARTFVFQFISEKGHSKYENAHISTDIEEAQAWNSGAVNDRIKKAVADTRGKVIVYNGEFARAWFHSNAGGKTATPKEGLNYKDEEPPYIKVVDSPDTTDAVEADAKSWYAKFTKENVIAALGEVGKPVKDFTSVAIGQKGPSGRAITIKFDETEVSAAELRLALGTTDMRSTLLDNIALEGGNLVMSGKGYGHGVGMSQWGGYVLAQQGESYEDIINHYFKDINIVTMWE